MRILTSLSPFSILRQLRKGQEASTFERLGHSRHVADLRLIFSVTIIITVAASGLALLFCLQHEVMSNWIKIRDRDNDWILVQIAFTAIADSGAFIGAVGAVACGVLAWTYQTGSARLGVVDLFACEIATICRVATVTDMVPRYIDLFHTRPSMVPPQKIDGEMPTDGARFTSQESYFPVFDASITSLQQLESDVVNNVTAFYTYMKVMRDSLRKLADIRRPTAENRHGDEWHRAICNVIYMQFLGLESARKALRSLVEFEPTQAEDICTVLLSELVAYGFLRKQFKGDLRERRLEARDEEYRHVVPDLCRLVAAGVEPKWDKAKDLAEEVAKRYADIFLGDAGRPGQAAA